MTDLWDTATEREEEFRDDAIASVRRRLPPDGEAHSECLICDAKIPPERQRALPGVATCVDCQHELEKALR